jgi:hypothetical protein
MDRVTGLKLAETANLRNMLEQSVSHSQFSLHTITEHEIENLRRIGKESIIQ